MEEHEKVYNFNGSGELLPTPNNMSLLLDRIERLERAVIRLKEADEYFTNRMRND